MSIVSKTVIVISSEGSWTMFEMPYITEDDKLSSSLHVYTSRITRDLYINHRDSTRS